jgi:hypothetical protein
VRYEQAFNSKAELKENKPSPVLTTQRSPPVLSERPTRRAVRFCSPTTRVWSAVGGYDAPGSSPRYGRKNLRPRRASPASVRPRTQRRQQAPQLQYDSFGSLWDMQIEMGKSTPYEVTTISPSLRLSAEVISRFRDYCLAPGAGPPGPRPPAGAALIWPSSQCSSALPSTNRHMSKWVVV